MIGLDSNIIIRYFAQDDAKQSAAATRLIERQLSERGPGYVSLVVLVEAVWVMVDSYAADRQLVRKLIEGLLSAPQLRIQHAEQVWRALRVYERGKAEFSDALIGELAQEAGSRFTQTFDLKAARLPGFKLLQV